MYLFPALTCEPVIGSLEAFTKGILRVFEAVLTEPETEINTGRLAPEASALSLSVYLSTKNVKSCSVFTRQGIET